MRESCSKLQTLFIFAIVMKTVLNIARDPPHLLSSNASAILRVLDGAAEAKFVVLLAVCGLCLRCADLIVSRANTGAALLELHGVCHCDSL